MSGIAGIYNLDGRPVDPALLIRIVKSFRLAYPRDLQLLGAVQRAILSDLKGTGAFLSTASVGTSA